MNHEETLKNKLQRLQKKQEILQEEWNKRSQKLKSLRLDLAAKARAADKFELEHDIQKEEASLRTLQEDLDNIETEIDIITQELRESSIAYEYRVTGPLPANALTYVERKADKELFNSLMSGKFCYVFNSRQMGKSSLRVRVKASLEAKRVVCVTLLPTMIVSNDLTEDQWYRGIINSIVLDLGLGRQFDDTNWWERQGSISGVQKFNNFIREELLRRVPQKIVIFVDEIDRILSLNFNLDSFFATIRECYNKRAEIQSYERLTFALLGVATPSDLIRDGFSTPFNIGHAIDLTGFTFEEAQPLVTGLVKANNPQDVLKEIIDWTNGQPFLTQKLCSLVQENEDSIPNDGEKDWIKNLVDNNITENLESEDVVAVHLKAISDRIRGDISNKRLLEIYQKILTNVSIEVDGSPDQKALCLSGLVVKKGNRLKIYNPIYKAFFNQNWLDKSLRSVAVRPYAEQIDSWQASGCKEQSKLLYGEALKKARKWSEGVLLSQEDNRFLLESQELDQRVNFLPDSNTQESVIEAVMSWTNGQKELNDNIFLLLSNNMKLAQVSAKNWVDQIIHSRMIDRWQTEALAQPLKHIKVQLLENQIVDPFWLLILYRQVLFAEEVRSDNHQYQEELKRIGIVTKRDGQLSVANRIYENVFNLIWVNQNLGELRPYAKKLVAWIDSNFLDRSHLLSAREFKIAQEWTRDRQIDERENRFLIDSMIWNT